MIKTLGTALTLLAALILGITAAQAQTTPMAHATRVAVHRRPCKGKHGRALRRCRARQRSRARTAVAADAALAQGATSAYGAEVSWPAVAGASGVGVYVNGQMVDQFPASGVDSYELSGLWPSTRFAVSVVVNRSSGQAPARFSRSVLTAPVSGAFPRLYAPDAFINTPVSSSPGLAAGSGAMVSEAIGNYSSTAELANDQAWGIPIVTASVQSDAYRVGCQTYSCDTDFGVLRIPASAQPDTGSDGHLVVLQPDGRELDMWVAQRTSGGWTSGSRWVESANGPAANCTVVHQCGGADAADFALGAGVVRPEEIAQGHIDHALAITTPDTRQGYIACPATGSDGKHSNPGAIPIGAHLQLDPSINVSNLPIAPWQKVIATALQQYGAYVVDTGGSIGIYAQSDTGRSYNAWAKAGVSDNNPSISDLPWNSMRVLNMSQCGT